MTLDSIYDLQKEIIAEKGGEKKDSLLKEHDSQYERYNYKLKKGNFTRKELGEIFKTHYGREKWKLRI